MARLPKNFDLLPKYIANEIQTKIGNKIAKDMMTAYSSAIRSFYDDYQPVVYKRRYRSYFFVDPNGARGYVKLIKPDTNKKGFSVVMNITPDNIRVHYTSLTGRFSGPKLDRIVFNNTFVLGQHGNNLPLSILPEDTQHSIFQAKPKRWYYNKSKGWVWRPPKMSTPPKAQIDAWFNQYTHSNEIDKIVQDATSASIRKILLSYNKQHILER